MLGSEKPGSGLHLIRALLWCGTCFSVLIPIVALLAAFLFRSELEELGWCGQCEALRAIYIVHSFIYSPSWIGFLGETLILAFTFMISITMWESQQRYASHTELDWSSLVLFRFFFNAAMMLYFVSCNHLSDSYEAACAITQQAPAVELDEAVYLSACFVATHCHQKYVPAGSDWYYFIFLVNWEAKGKALCYES